MNCSHTNSNCRPTFRSSLLRCIFTAALTRLNYHSVPGCLWVSGVLYPTEFYHRGKHSLLFSLLYSYGKSITQALHFICLKAKISSMVRYLRHFQYSSMSATWNIKPSVWSHILPNFGRRGVTNCCWFFIIKTERVG